MRAQNRALELDVLASAARTADGNSEAFDNGAQYDELLLAVDATVVSGTAPTLDGDLEFSPDGGTTWFVHSSMTQLTAAGKAVIQATNFGWKWRFAYRIGGTTPSFTFSVHAALKRLGK